MARALSSRALIGSTASTGPCLLLLSSLPATRLLALRHSSGPPGGVHFVEIDLDAEGSSPGSGSASASGSGETDALRKRRAVDDAIRNAVAVQYAPAWLPFVPGASYWVPRQKRPAYRVLELAASPADPKISRSLSKEEKMSFTTERGWPSSAYFFEGLSAQQVKSPPPMVPKTQSDDEDS